MTSPIDPNLIAESNSAREALLRTDYEHIAGQLQRRGIDIDAITARVQTLEIALPTWGVGTGGTRLCSTRATTSPIRSRA
jgi:L-rhamnose isomerase/sugar isomerase